MPKLSSAAPAFAVADVGDTIHWYQEQLGFTAYPFPETPPYVFAIESRETVEIMFQRVPGYIKPDLYSEGGLCSI